MISKLPKTAFFVAVLSTAIMLLASTLGDKTSVIASYVPSILAGVVASTAFALLSVRAWGQKPPGETVAWVFGHLTIWAAAFTFEEIGWVLWRIMGENPSTVAFEYTIASALKLMQSSAILGVVLIVQSVYDNIEGSRLATRARLFWAFNMLVGTTYFIVFHRIF